MGNRALIIPNLITSLDVRNYDKTTALCQPDEQESLLARRVIRIGDCDREGSPKLVPASVNDMWCLRRLDAALTASHEKRNAMGRNYWIDVYGAWDLRDDRVPFPRLLFATRFVRSAVV